MTEREYRKYNFNVTDALGEKLNVGDCVIINNYYNNRVLIGVISHYTDSHRIAVFTKSLTHNSTWWSYRYPESLVKVKGKQFDKALRKAKQEIMEKYKNTVYGGKW